MSDNREESIRSYAESRYRHEIDYQKEHNPQRFATVTQADLDRYLGQCVDDARKVADEIDDKTKLAVAYLRGRFHPDNKRSRRLFTDLTGISLPPTVCGTANALETYCGTEIKAELDRRRIEREAEEKAEQKAEQRKRGERKAELSARVAANKYLDGSELVELCGMLGIELHPRTIAMLRKRVLYIKSDSASTIKGGGAMPQSAFHAYLSCASAVS